MKGLLIIFSFLTLFSCQSDLKLPKKPKDLILKEKMIEVSQELLLVETAIETRYGTLAKFHKISTQSGREILKKYRISESQYFSSLRYYSCHKEEIEEIYNTILDNLNLMRN